MSNATFKSGHVRRNGGLDGHFVHSNPHHRQQAIQPEWEMVAEEVNCCNMFHSGQQSSAILDGYRQRGLACYDQMRRAQLNQLSLQCHVPPYLPRSPLPHTLKLTMEAQNSDFSSLLGQNEAWAINDSIASIMHDTGCMIQFADQHVSGSEDNSVYFNKVTITGAFPNIDEAQRRIRDLAPISIAISLKNRKSSLASSATSESNFSGLFIDWCAPSGRLAKYARIQFNIAQEHQWHSRSRQDKHPFLVIRGSYSDREDILKACEEVRTLLFDSDNKEEFCTRMEVPVKQRRWVVGSPDGILMRAISTLSGATIHFPVSSKGLTPTSYYITGSALSCIHAVKLLYDVSPVRMEFEVENGALARPCVREEDREFNRFDTVHNVIVSMRQSLYEGSTRLRHEKMRHSISIMTSEENINNIYVVRRLLLKGNMYIMERAPPHRRTRRPCFTDYLRVLVSEAGPKAGQAVSKKAIDVPKKGFSADNDKQYNEIIGDFGDYKIV